MAVFLGATQSARAEAELTPIGCIDASGQADCGAQMPAALGNPVQVVSPPGSAHAYAVVSSGTGGAIDALVHFRRAADGSLSFADCLAARAGFGCAVPQAPEALFRAERLVVSDDGADVYVAGRYGAVSHFRTDSSGVPHPVGCFGDSDAGCNEPSDLDLYGWQPMDLALSSDGRQLHVVGDDAPELLTLRRDGEGRLSLDGCAGYDVACDVPPVFCTSAEGCRRTDALFKPRALAVSPDGRAIYVASSFNNSRSFDTVAHFRRDADGDPHYASCVGEGRGCSPLPPGATITGARGIAVGPDSRSVYLATEADGDPRETSIARFRASADGALTFAECIGTGANNCRRAPDRSPEELLPWSIAISPDGQDLYVGHLYHVRLAADGSMSWNGCWGGGFGCRPLWLSSSDRKTTTVSADGRNVYSATGDRVWSMSRSATSAPGSGSPPEVIVDPVYNVESYSVSLAARVKSTAGPALVHFELGRTTNYELGGGTVDSSVAKSDQFVPVYAGRYELRPDTTYRYRVVARNRSGTTVSAEHSFRTRSGGGVAPTARTESANTVGPTYATLNGAVRRSEDTTMRFEYGTSPSYGSSVTAAEPLGPKYGSREQWVNATLTGLAPDRTYYYRLVASGPSGSSYGAQRTFRTNKQPIMSMAPSVDEIRASAPTPTAATLRATLDPAGSSTRWWFEHGATRSLGSRAPASEGELRWDAGATEVTADLNGLAPASDHYFRVVAVGSAGKVESRIVRFTTPAEGPPTPPAPPASQPQPPDSDPQQPADQPRQPPAPTSGGPRASNEDGSRTDPSTGDALTPVAPSGTGLPAAIDLTLRVRRQRLRTAIRRGLLVEVGAGQRVVTRVTVAMRRGSTRRARSSGTGRQRWLIGPGSRRVRVRLPARMRRSLRRAKRTTLVVKATATATDGRHTDSARRRVKLRR